MTISHLPDRAVLAVTGEGARDFLQGLISNDMRKVSGQQAIFATLLSPQGKYLFEFFIIEHAGKLLLETHKSRLPDLIKRLTLYRLRAKVEFAEEPLHVAAMWNENTTMPDAISYADPRLPALGTRLLLPSPCQTNGDYEQHRLTLGVPEGDKDLIPDRSLLLEYGYDKLNAIDFTKGCYVGQEVTARSKHRGTLHKSIHQVQGNAPLPPPGTIIYSQGKEAGEIRSSQGMLGLALIRHEASETALMAADSLITAKKPAWSE